MLLALSFLAIGIVVIGVKQSNEIGKLIAQAPIRHSRTKIGQFEIYRNPI
jgi:hypothetical protein